MQEAQNLNLKDLVDGWVTGESYPEYTAMGTTALSGTSADRTSCAKVDSTNAVVKCVCVEDWEYQKAKATPGTQGKTVKVCIWQFQGETGDLGPEPQSANPSNKYMCGQRLYDCQLQINDENIENIDKNSKKTNETVDAKIVEVGERIQPIMNDTEVRFCALWEEFNAEGDFILI